MVEFRHVIKMYDIFSRIHAITNIIMKILIQLYNNTIYIILFGVSTCIIGKR